MRTKAGISGISLSPHPHPLYAGRAAKNMEGRSTCRKNNDHYQYKFLGVIRILCNLRRKNHSIRAFFFFWRETEISFITKILAADWLRSHVTITLRDKSRYDLILKINETA